MLALRKRYSGVHARWQ